MDDERGCSWEAQAGKEVAGGEHVTPVLHPLWIHDNGIEASACSHINTSDDMDDVVRSVINVPKNNSGY